MPDPVSLHADRHGDTSRRSVLAPTRNGHLAGVGELDGVRQQVDQDLADAVLVGHDASGTSGSIT